MHTNPPRTANCCCGETDNISREILVVWAALRIGNLARDVEMGEQLEELRYRGYQYPRGGNNHVRTYASRTEARSLSLCVCVSLPVCLSPLSQRLLQAACLLAERKFRSMRTEFDTSG